MNKLSNGKLRQAVGFGFPVDLADGFTIVGSDVVDTGPGAESILLGLGEAVGVPPVGEALSGVRVPGAFKLSGVEFLDFKVHVVFQTGLTQ